MATRSLIGTTDVPVARPEEAVDRGRGDRLSLRRRQRLFRAADRARPTWSGPIRASARSTTTAPPSAKDVTRDYHLELDPRAGPETALGLRRQDHHRPRAGARRRSTCSASAASSSPPPRPPRRQHRRRLQRPPGRRSPRWMPAPLRPPPRRAPTAPGSSACSAAPTSLADLGRHFGAGLYEARGPLSDRHGIRPHRRGHPLAPHQARPGDDEGGAAGAGAVARQKSSPLMGRGWGWGERLRTGTERASLSSPHPSPPHQGEGNGNSAACSPFLRHAFRPEASACAGPGDSVIGWKLDRGAARRAAPQFPPRYRNVVADHVTLQSRAAARRAAARGDRGRDRRPRRRRQGRRGDGRPPRRHHRPPRRLAPITSPGRSTDGRRARRRATT